MRGHKPPTPVQQVAPSASELQCWGSENLGVLPVAGAADTLTERKQCHRIYYCRSQKWGGGWYSEPAERPSSVPGHKEETENRVARPYYKVGEEITSFFPVLNSKWLLCKVSQEQQSGNWWRESNCPDSGREQGGHSVKC